MRYVFCAGVHAMYSVGRRWQGLLGGSWDEEPVQRRVRATCTRACGAEPISQGHLEGWAAAGGGAGAWCACLPLALPRWVQLQYLPVESAEWARMGAFRRPCRGCRTGLWRGGVRIELCCVLLYQQFLALQVDQVQGCCLGVLKP